MKRDEEPPKVRPVVVPIRPAPEAEEEEVDAGTAWYAQLDEAVREQERALAVAVMKRAEAISHRDPEGARRDISYAMVLDPESADPWYQLAVLEFNDDEALVSLNEALARDGSNADYYGTRGGIYVRREELARALADYDRAVHLEQEHVVWLTSRARLLHKLGRWDDAWRDYTRALRRSPRFKPLLHERACVLVDKGDFAGARRELDRLIDAYPELIACVREKALLCHRVGDSSSALAAIDHVIAALAGDRYRDGFDHYIRGAILFSMGDARAALAAFDEGIAGDVSGGPFEARRAQCLLALGKSTEALSACNRAVANQTYCDAFLLWRARVLQSIGGRDALGRALSDLRKAIARAPKVACFHAEKAMIHAQQGRKALAREEARRALRLMRKPQQPHRIYHALLEEYETRGLDLGHPPPVARDVLLRIARKSKT